MSYRYCYVKIPVPSQVSPPRRSDRGTTLVEILIAIVLMGMTVTATMTALSTTNMASAVDRDHANAHAWLQTSADMLYASPLKECSGDTIDMVENETIRAGYEATLQQTQNPEGWEASNLVVVDLQYWNVDLDANSAMEEDWSYRCDTASTNLQRLQIEVRAPDGTIVEQVEVIIGE